MNSIPAKTIVILDRDGVINEYPGDFDYVKSPEAFKMLPGVKKAVKMLNKANFKVCIASNQAGVTKGIYTQEALDKITQKMHHELKEVGAVIDEVNYCIHRDEDNCTCRKPKTGLLEKAAGNNKSQTYFIGDTLRDVITAKNFGCKSILVLSGKIKHITEVKNWEFKPDFIVNNLLEAAELLLKKREELV